MNFIYIKYWCGKYNLGDVFSEFLFDSIYDKVLLNRIPDRKTLMFIGSEIPSWTDNSRLVCGLGWRQKTASMKCQNARPENFLYVRGKISRQRVVDSGIDIPHDLPIGDSGLLASLLYRPHTAKKHDIGIITHWSAAPRLQQYLELAKNKFPEKNIAIMQMGDKTKTVFDLFEFICSCKVVVASSLHAIIFSHSFRVPALFFSDVDGYKFQDYYSVYERIDYKQLTKQVTLDESLEKVDDHDFILSVNPTDEEVHQVQKNIISAMPYRWCFTDFGKKLIERFGVGPDNRTYVKVSTPELKASKCLFMQNKDMNVLANSSSGGVVPALIDLVRAQGGSAFGVVFSDDFMSLKYVEIDDTNMHDAMGSKYINAALSKDNKERILELLKQRKKVLFVGRPCQCYWMRNHYRQYPNLILVELFCFGVPQDTLWTAYAQKLVNSHGKIKSVNFRDKSNGWIDYKFKMEFEDGTVIDEPHQENQYMKDYLSRQHVMPKCKTCQIRQMASFADVSCGDAWGIKTDNNNGTSVVLCHTQMGENLLNQISSKFNIQTASDDQLFRAFKSNRGFSSVESVNFNYIKKFPQKELKLEILNEPSQNERFDAIISFSTYKLRLDKGHTLEFLERLVNQKFNGKFHIVANMWKPDYETCSQEVKDYLNKHNIEIILTNVDYRTHNKYCFVFQKYRNIPIATFDDDQLYRYDSLQLMFDTHKRHPRTLIGGFCVIPGGIVDEKTGRRGKPRPLTGTPPARGIQIWGSGGNFYPPEFTEKITISMIEEWIQNSAVNCKYDNDMYLFRMAKRFGFNGMVVECNHEKPTWRGYLVEKFLPTADDETAKTWNKA